MPGPFYERLRAYYVDVAKVLRGEASASSVFPNTTDIGISREQVYAEFLRQHAPSKCNVFLGGFLFGEDGTESGQLDVIITTDTTPRFNLNNKDGKGKSFAPVEGSLGVVAIKSMLDKRELEETLWGIAAIPPTASLQGRVNPQLSIKNYEDWPYKIIYASNGILPGTLFSHLNNFYDLNPDIPLTRRPNIIHVSGKYVIVRIIDRMIIWDHKLKEKISLKTDDFRIVTSNADIQGLLWVLDELQEKSNSSTHILYRYSSIINYVQNVPACLDAQDEGEIDGKIAT